MINPFFKDLGLNNEPTWVVFTHGVVKGSSITKKYIFLQQATATPQARE